MELNLKKNLFRYGKNESLTFGVILALIFFDILIWSIVSMGMISVDYKFANQNDCLYQVQHVINHDEVFPANYYYPKVNGKYCKLFQERYKKVYSTTSVSAAVNQIRSTESQISKLRNNIESARRKLDGNATAYNLAIKEKKGLDLAYTEGLEKIQRDEAILSRLNQDLTAQKQGLKNLPPVRDLIQYARENLTRITQRYRFMQRLDLFLSYVFAMMFIIILIPICIIFHARLAKKEKYIRLLLVNHILLIAVLQGICITVQFILHILPKTLLRNIIQFFESLHLMALWYYIAIFLLFGLFAAVVYFLQTKGKRRNLYKKLLKGRCWKCGARVLDNDFCFSCGEKQVRTCPHCKKKTYIKMPYCRSCGRELKEI